jgi:hypothetical protein
MDRREAIDFLHKSGYSRRISAKLVDIAMMEKDKPFIAAIKKAVEKNLNKSKKKKQEKIKYIVYPNRV